MNLTLARIAALLEAESSPSSHAEVAGCSIDSRTVRPGELFFAVAGERFDGHDFVEAALANGAVAAVVRRDQIGRYPAGAPLVAVADPLASLQRLAGAVRRMWGRRVIGLTGSAGKTTTKEAVAQVLASRFRVLKSQGNLNNGFGLPLQLLKLEPRHEVAVIEMGMNHAGEIRALAGIARPDWGVVTNVGPVHTENFADGIAGVARAKYELVESLPANGTAILNADDPYVSQFGRNHRGAVILYGEAPTSDVRVENVADRGLAGSTFDVVCDGVRTPVALALLGRHNVQNALAAIAVGVASGIGPSACAEALAALRPSDKRGEVLRVHGATLVNDCYNSNPKALDAMVDALAGMEGRRRIVVAGEMLELGPEAEALHRACGQRMAEKGVDLVVGVRGHAKATVEGAAGAGVPALFVETPEEAGRWLRETLREGDTVLLKASRGVRLERALEALTGIAASNASH